MANRRKFIAGLGALATGSAAAMGTGAFSSVRAERAISVTTAGDSGAYLGLDASTSVYAEETGDTLELQFDGSNSGQNGNGLNANADTSFTNVMRVENNGTNTVRLQLANDDGSIGSLPNGPMVVSFTDSELTSDTIADSTPFAAVQSVPSWWSNSGNVNNQDLAPGDDLYVHFAFYLNDDVQSLGAGPSTALSNVPDDIGFYADASSENGSDFTSS